MLQSLHPGTGPSLIPWRTVNTRQWAMWLPCLPSSGPFSSTSPSHHSCGSRLKAHEEISACLVNTSLISYIIYSILWGPLHPACIAHYPLWTNLHKHLEPHPDSIITLWEVSPTSHQRLRGPCSARSKPAFMRGTLI